MAEQREKVTLAATGEDESRHSQATRPTCARTSRRSAIYANSRWVRSMTAAAIDERMARLIARRGVLGHRG
jgi:hypothetical protein